MTTAWFDEQDRVEQERAGQERVERALATAWFDQQDRLTPEDLLTAAFPLTRLGRRGEHGPDQQHNRWH